MASVEFDRSRVLHRRDEVVDVRGRHSRIVHPPHDQHRRRHAPHGLAQIHVAQGRAAGGVTLHRRRADHGAHGIDSRRGALGKRGAEEALDRRGHGLVHALRARGGDPLVPARGRAELGRSADDHRPIDPLRGMGEKPEAHHATHRHTAEMRPLDFQLVKNVEHVAAEPVDAEPCIADVAAAVATRVEADDAEPLQRGQKAVPQRQIRAEHVGQHERRGRFGAVDPHLEAAPSRMRFVHRHRLVAHPSSFKRFLARRTSIPNHAPPSALDNSCPCGMLESRKTD